MLKLSDIHIRDPFVLVDHIRQRYVMYGTPGKYAWEGKPESFDAYVSHDLDSWQGPFKVFQPDEQFWADHHYWAPEVHFYNGSYYMFASFKAEGVPRATQILRAQDPLGPFVPHSAEPITPAAWECLDGTLYVESDGQPWIVFCREWLEVGDGQIWAAPLSADLAALVAEPILLFKASDATWTRFVREQHEFVTDGPYLYRNESNQLCMLWSSHGEHGYAMGRAISQTGTIAGPWQQEQQPLFAANGGHGMIFTDFSSNDYLALHAPNVHPDERPIFLPFQRL